MSSKSSKTFRKQALSLIIFFVAVAAVFFVASRLRGDPAEKQAQTILTQLLSSSDAVKPAVDDSYTASEPGLVQVDDSDFVTLYQAQFGDSMTEDCLNQLLANRLPTRIATISDQHGGDLEVQDLKLTRTNKDGDTAVYSFSASLQSATEQFPAATASGLITMTQESGTWKASALTLNLK